MAGDWKGKVRRGRREARKDQVHWWNNRLMRALKHLGRKMIRLRNHHNVPRVLDDLAVQLSRYGVRLVIAKLSLYWRIDHIYLWLEDQC